MNVKIQMKVYDKDGRRFDMREVELPEVISASDAALWMAAKIEALKLKPHTECWRG